MKKIFSIFICVLSLQNTKAQDDPFLRLRTAALKNQSEKAVLTGVKITTNNPRWQAISKAPISFTPFELKDMQGNPVPPDRMVTLKNGKQITAQEYIKQLNLIEQKLSEQGYSLRSRETMVISKTVTPEQTLQGKVATFVNPIGPMRKGESLQNFMTPSKRIGNMTLKPMSFYTPAEKAEVGRYDFTEIPGGVSAVRTNKVKRIYKGDINNIMIGGIVSPLKVIDVTDRKDWSLGDRATFQAGVEASLTRYAKIYPFDPANPEKSMSEFRVSATGRVYGALFDHSMDLLNASGEFNAPADTAKKMTAKIQVKTSGITIFNIDESFAQSKNFSNISARSFDKSFPIEVPIGFGFNFSGKIGVKGMAGFEYGATLYRTFASVQGKPLADLEGYAEAGLDFLGVVGGGVGGNITFLKGDLELQAFAGIWSQNAEQIVLAVTYYFGYDLDILSGKLYCYVEVCAPDWLGGGCWRPVQHDFFNWEGYKRSGTLAEGSASYVLANVWRRQEPLRAIQ